MGTEEGYGSRVIVTTTPPSPPVLTAPAAHEVSYGLVRGVASSGSRRVVVKVDGRTVAKQPLTTRRFVVDLDLPFGEHVVTVATFDARGRSARRTVRRRLRPAARRPATGARPEARPGAPERPPHARSWLRLELRLLRPGPDDGGRRGVERTRGVSGSVDAEARGGGDRVVAVRRDARVRFVARSDLPHDARLLRQRRSQSAGSLVRRFDERWVAPRQCDDAVDRADADRHVRRLRPRHAPRRRGLREHPPDDRRPTVVGAGEANDRVRPRPPQPGDLAGERRPRPAQAVGLRVSALPTGGTSSACSPTFTTTASSIARSRPTRRGCSTRQAGSARHGTTTGSCSGAVGCSWQR